MADSYDDIRRVWVKTDLFSDNADRGSSDGAFFWEPGWTLEPVEERNEFAELVAIDIWKATARAREQDNLGTTPGHVDGQLEVSESPELQALNNSISSVDSTSNNQSFADGDAIMQRWFNGDSPVLVNTFCDTTSAFNDTVNGTGGGAGRLNRGIERLHFRTDFGRGPIFDRHDRIYLNGSLQGIQSPNQDWQILTELQLYFHDFEASEVEGIQHLI